MIVEALFNLLFVFLNPLIAMIPDVEVFSSSMDLTAYAHTFLEYVRMACYFLPMGTVITLFTLIYYFILFRIFVSVVKTIWDLLPFV